MEHYRLRKYRGPEVWARVRAAYEAGESGASVARRFDVGLSNLRKKARKEGWTRKDIARRLDEALEPRRPDAEATRASHIPAVEPARSVDPREALEQAMHRAGGLLAEGRGAEAQSLIRSAESLARLVERTEPRADEDGGETMSQDAIDRHMAERDATSSRRRPAWPGPC